MHLQTNADWKYFRDNLDVWVLENTDGTIIPIQRCAPIHWRRLSVPPEVSDWLDRVLTPEVQFMAAHHRHMLFERAMDEAAKANT
ncbi:MAG: hypothetical protein KDB68_05170 [Planctomycetes bacterium]|nr:hypothetical protein [Planctomycetota bacterium]